VSGYWQSQDCDPGERWEVAGRVRHPSTKPLTGQNRAIVNVEWRDSSDQLIYYESHTVAGASSPTDVYLGFEILSAPAPTGTASARVVFAVLQEFGSVSPDVYYDAVRFESTSAPTVDDLQWNDFPGGTTVDFGGYTWRVKGPGIYGPGTNRFCNTGQCVWVDAENRLHLTLQYLGGQWYSTEVTLEPALGYGDYVVTTRGRLDQIDPEVVLGLFLWQYGPCWDPGYLWWNAFNEIDIEYSRWGNPGQDIAQFVAQPYDWPGNITRFEVAFADDEVVSHAMRWLPDRVEYRVWRGGPDEEATSPLVNSWTYTGPHIPRPEQPRLHLNLWKLDGAPAFDQEVVFEDFTFVPAGGPTAVGEPPEGGLTSFASGRLRPAQPNPFNPSTTIRFELDRGGFTRLDVYDIAGRHVRSLLAAFRSAGDHDVTWNGRDNDGRSVASGVYLVRLDGGDFVETRRVALIK
jgi:hypothetical protein